MGTLHIVGLGPGDPDSIPLGSYEMMRRGFPVVLRTREHPAVKRLEEAHVPFESCDDLYQTSDTFDAVYEAIVARLIHLAEHHPHVVYAVPGHPLVAERAVQMLLAQPHPGVEVELGPGQSFLDLAVASLGIDPIEGLLLLDGLALRQDQLNPRLHTFIAQVYDRDVASDVKLTLMQLYPDEYEVVIVRAAGVRGEERIERVPLYEIDRLPWLNHLTTLYVPPASEAAVLYRDLHEAPRIVEVLRGPNGCPWDRKQTHASLRKYVIEEAYEVADAIDAGDPDHLAEELGDLLLQILLHARIAEEAGEFALRDVFAGLAAKLVRRHPHVFGEEVAETPDDVRGIWEQVKQDERRNEEREESALSGVKFAGPALGVAQEVQKAAAKVGFDWSNEDDVWQKVKEEMNELDMERRREPRDGAKLAAEAGDLLFAVVNLCRFLKLDAESVLAQATRRFARRFRYVEERLRSDGGSWETASPEALDAYWNEAKIAFSPSN
ncbi:bifunctional methyltransferase/pyrophosphohydrolase YabN [Alicyclobacillus vulcanalis]|uniref:Tetrapyrrole methylase family protein / MazG family protein n=1 Tax=Alicyclobacillus vulcanalis TaxID=252246 RepID=A0A1N7MJ01_9BACL|nr:nucleoside triphosphate pyrophosphohydrolase [Alicyclobacillus vulcanalis]SIS85988.1 tetrapyrrole methylase family protein / MazG family protein [Alicyclobacillus vulcanalis]